MGDGIILTFVKEEIIHGMREKDWIGLFSFFFLGVIQLIRDEICSSGWVMRKTRQQWRPLDWGIERDCVVG